MLELHSQVLITVTTVLFSAVSVYYMAMTWCFWCSNRSICYLRLGCAEKAIADADEAIRLKPEWQKP